MHLIAGVRIVSADNDTAGKMRDHRRNCAKELLETELQYVKALETVIQVLTDLFCPESHLRQAYPEPRQFHYKLHSASTQDTDKPYLSQEQVC